MNYIRIGIAICIMLAFFTPKSEAQTLGKVKVEAVVLGADNKPLPAAEVICEEEEISIVTDDQGKFSLNMYPNSQVLIKAPGYKSKFVDVSLAPKEIELEVEDLDFVQVAFRKVEKKDLLGGISVVNLPEKMEKNYTTYSLDGMEAYVGGFNGNLWSMGSDYLLLIDGVPREATNVLASEIEQITFLKGASAVALYGSRAAKGVIYISTKRGKANTKEINVRANTGIYVPKSYPEYLGSAEYMTLYNEARKNDGLASLYNDETIYHHASGMNPYRYPNVNFYSSDYIRKFYNRSDMNAEISGGNERARFYTNVGFDYTNSLLNFGEAKDDNTNRLNIRGNIDLNINSFIKGTVDATAIFYNSRNAHGNYWGQAATLRPHRLSPFIPVDMIDQEDINSLSLINNTNNIVNFDGRDYFLGGTQLDQTNPFADVVAGGHNKSTGRQFFFNTSLDIDMGRLLKGLSFHTQFAVDYSTSYNQAYNNSYATFAPNWTNFAGSQTDIIASLTKYGEDSKSGVQNISNSTYKQTIAFSGQFNYETIIQGDHKISSMLIANGYQQSQSEVYQKVNNVNLALNIAYNYKDKYYGEFSGSGIHSGKLAKGNRIAFSPAVSLGWRLKKEAFLENSPIVDDLKLTASASILNSDMDISEYYLYETYYTQINGAWYSWRDGTLQKTTDSRRGGNKDLGFIKRKEISIGAEAIFFDKMLTINTSFFANRMEGLLVQPSTQYPMYFMTYWPSSSFMPYKNFNNDQRIGFDFSATLNKQIGAVDWALGVAGTINKTKAVKRDEMYEDDYQNRTARPLDALWGLQSDGFFADEADIANSPSHAFGEVKPGDIKYIDQNGDDIIDSKDEIYLGHAGWNGAPFTFGINLSAKWRDFTFFMLGTGNFGAHAFKNNSYYWVQGDGKYSAVVRNRWTEDTKDTATYPRLTSLTSDNNFRNSDFWLYKTDRFNLAKVQVTYDFPKQILGDSFIRGISVYVSGANLLTIAKERKILEQGVGTIPQTRIYNLGVKAVF